MQVPKKDSLKTTEEIVEEEYYDEEEPSVQSMDTNLELKRLQELVENNRNIPDVIILKDEHGVPQEYEVLVES
jgi:anion-transporting  ArsA/GET3 family ATPase